MQGSEQSNGNGDSGWCGKFLGSEMEERSLLLEKAGEGFADEVTAGRSLER